MSDNKFDLLSIRPLIIGLILISILVLPKRNMTLSVALSLVSVTPTIETDPVPTSGDAADDPAIWIHPTVPGLSTIIATDKALGGGIVVYNLDGSQIQYLPDGEINNVDLRYNFPLGGESVALVTASNRTNDSIAIYKVDPSTRQLVNVAANTNNVGISVYGACMYRSPTTGKYYHFVNNKSGVVQQWELFDDGAGKVAAALRRTFDVGTQVEGCVADDVFAEFYIGEESVAIWKYGAEPGDGELRSQVDVVGPAGQLTANIEGLTLYYDSTHDGYLIASSQGNSTFVIYNRSDNAYVGTFEIVAGNGIDKVSGTDGIDVTNFPLGSLFPQGVFVAQDGNNDVGNQNYKLVPWQAIANAFSPALTIDTLWDPRLVGANDLTPTPTPTPTGTPTPTSTNTPAASPTYTLTPTATIIPAQSNHWLYLPLIVNSAPHS